MKIEKASEVLQESKRENEIMRDNPTIFWRSVDMEAGIQNAQSRIEAINTALTALCSVSRVQELEAENKELKERIVNWRKYMAPAHIDRRAWTAEWVPTTDDDGCVWLECSACEYDLDSMEESNPFCPSCGRAMTEEAWTELERRLRG